MRRSERVSKPLSGGLSDCGYDSIPHSHGSTVLEYQNAENTVGEYSSSEVAVGDLNIGGDVGAYPRPDVAVEDSQIQGHTAARHNIPWQGQNKHENSADFDEDFNLFCD